MHIEKPENLQNCKSFNNTGSYGVFGKKVLKPDILPLIPVFFCFTLYV